MWCDIYLAGKAAILRAASAPNPLGVLGVPAPLVAILLGGAEGGFISLASPNKESLLSSPKMDIVSGGGGAV